MGDAFKRNWKKVSGVRADSDLTSEDILRLLDEASLTTNASGIGGIPVDTTSVPSGTVLIFDGTQWVAGTVEATFGSTVSISGTLTALGTTTLQGAVVMGDTATVSGAFVAEDSATVNGTLDVGGATTISGATTIDSSLTVNSGLVVTDTAVVSGLVVQGDATVSGTLTVFGPSLDTAATDVNSAINEVRLLAISGITLPSGALGPAGGDLTGQYPNPTVTGIQNVEVSATSPVAGQVLAFNGTAYAPSGIVVPSAPPSGPAGGDLDGTYPNPTVTGLQGVEVSSVSPVAGQVLTFNGTAYAPSGIVVPSAPPSGPAGGDLGGTYPDPTVTGLQGVEVAPTTPTSTQVLTFNGTRWAPATPAAGGGGGGSGILSTVVVTVSGALTNAQTFAAVSGALALDLPPSPVDGQTHYIKDAQGNAATSGNSIQVNGNGKLIDGDAFVTISNNFESISVLYIGDTLDTWLLF